MPTRRRGRHAGRGRPADPTWAGSRHPQAGGRLRGPALRRLLIGNPVEGTPPLLREPRHSPAESSSPWPFPASRARAGSPSRSSRGRRRAPGPPVGRQSPSLLKPLTIPPRARIVLGSMLRLLVALLPRHPARGPGLLAHGRPHPRSRGEGRATLRQPVPTRRALRPSSPASASMSPSAASPGTCALCPAHREPTPPGRPSSGTTGTGVVHSRARSHEGRAASHSRRPSSRRSARHHTHGS
jgi:hypothetical protein